MFKSSAGKDSHVWLPSIFPWVIVGDFNAITFTDKHKGTTFHYYGRKAFLFNNFISNNSLIDVGFSSSMYSWCNGQRGQSRRWARLDRFLVNSFWLSCINKSHLNYLPKIFFGSLSIVHELLSFHLHFSKDFSFWEFLVREWWLYLYYHKFFMH